MPTLDLSAADLLSTTRAVRKRLDLTRPIEPEVIRECLSLAVQAPTQVVCRTGIFLVIADPAQRAALAAIYRKSIHAPGGQEEIFNHIDCSRDL